MKLDTSQLKLWSIALVAIGSLAVGVTWQILEDRRSTLESAEKEIGQLASNLEASTVATFLAAELVADHIATMAQSKGDVSEDWLGLLTEHSFLSAITVIDPDGILDRVAIRSSDGSIREINRRQEVADKEAFRFHLEGRTSSSYIGLPRQGIELDRWIVPITRAVRSPQGDLMGVVYIGVALETFLNLYSNVLPADINSLSFTLDDGRLVFSYPFKEAVIGLSLAESGLFQSHLPNSPNGTYQAFSPIGQDLRIMSYRSMADWPAVLAVDSSLKNILSDWRERALIYTAFAFGASAMIVVLTSWLSVQMRRDEKTRKSLRVSQQSLETSQRMAGVGHFERDIRTNEFTWADNMYRIHGVAPDTFKPGRESFLGMVVEDDLEHALDGVHKIDSPADSGQLECRICRPDGAMRNMTYEWQVIRDHDGSPIRSFGVAQDITDLRETETAILENEARLRDITECISDFVWEGDEDGVLTYFESGASEVNLEVLVGVTSDENVDHSAGGGDWQFMVQAMDARQPYRNLVVPFQNREGETRWIRISANPRFDTAGAFIGWRGAGNDVTESRQQHIFQMEKNKSEALARLAGGMAHEINNLLQPVVVYSSFGDDKEVESEKAQSYFRKISTATHQAMGIVKDVLTFAREGQVRPEPVPLAETLRGSLDLVIETLPKSTSVDASLAQSDVYVGAQPNGIHQVLMNLVRNAADAVGSSGRISIEDGTFIRYPSDEGRGLLLPGRYGFFKVTDNGPGIEKSVLDKIFDPFFTTKPTGSGTGLGLSVVDGLVKEWGGSIDVESEPGKTVFTVYVPVVDVQRQAAE